MNSFIILWWSMNGFVFEKTVGTQDSEANTDCISAPIKCAFFLNSTFVLHAASQKTPQTSQLAQYFISLMTGWLYLYWQVCDKLTGHLQRHWDQSPPHQHFCVCQEVSEIRLINNHLCLCSQAQMVGSQLTLRRWNKQIMIYWSNLEYLINTTTALFCFASI